MDELMEEGNRLATEAEDAAMSPEQAAMLREREVAKMDGSMGRGQLSSQLVPPLPIQNSAPVASAAKGCKLYYQHQSLHPL